MIGTTVLPLHLVLGPVTHGVTRHALDLAAASGEPVCRLEGASPPTVEAVLGALAGHAAQPGTPVHVHVTDRLLGVTPHAAALLVEALAAVHPMSITLHDLPQPSDGAERFARRSDAYRRMAGAATCVQVSSHHERLLLAAVAPTARTVVVPLPVPGRDHLPRPTAGVGAPTAGVLGYLYPGKGHAEVLAALDQLDRPDVGLAALGGPSDGHEWLVAELRHRAGGRALEITGYLDDDELDRRIRDVTVPVVAPTHVSASGSLHRWIGCGRRPVALANPYTREVAASLPGTLTLTDDLPSAIAAALARPESTWLESSTGRAAPDGAAASAAAQAQSAAIRNAMASR